MGLVWRWLEQFYLSLTHVPLFGKSSSATPWTKHSMVGGFKRQNNIITFFLFILLWWLHSLLSPGTGESLLAKCRRVIITACLDCALAVDAERSISVWIYMDSLFVQVSLHLENKCFILPLLLEKSFFFLRCRCLLLAKYHSSCYPSFSALIICHHMMCLVSCISRF